MGADDSVACDVITGLKDVLRARFGEPIESESDRPLGRDMPGDAEICQDLFHHGLVRCGDYTRAFFTERSRFLAQDRLTPIDLQVRTLRYSAKELKEQGVWTKKTRERKVAILTISSATGADVVDPVVTGKIYFRYLN